MRRPRILAAGAVAFVLAAAATACGRGGSDGGGDGPIVVGAVYPLSGSDMEAGQDESRGVRIASDLANADGGIGGRPVKVLTVDTPSTAVPSVTGSRLNTPVWPLPQTSV